MSRVKLGSIELNVTGLGMDCGQYVAWIRMPIGKSIAQDWGGEPEGFRVRGWVEDLAEKARLVAVKAARKPVVFQLDENAYRVQCGMFRFEEDMGNGQLDYELELTVVEAPQTLVYVKASEIKAARSFDAYFALLRAEAQAYWFLGIADRVAGWVQEMEVRAASIVELAGDTIRLAELPRQTMGQVRQAAAVIVGQVGLLIEATTEALSGTRKFDEQEEGLKRALVAARAIETDAQALVTACDLVPSANTTAVVEQGDTLVTVAARWNREHDADVKWWEIAEANGIEDPAEVTAGTEVTIPG
ncbi:MAG: LysM peptidoglycan-binding domain-containing protein [Candidatus Methylomirabilota bacterium]